MPRYLLLKHYTGGPGQDFAPMSEWSEGDITAHIAAAACAGAVLVIHEEGTTTTGPPGAAALATQHAAAAVTHDAGTPSPAVRASATCPHISYGADGNAGPLFCSDGQPNPPVLAYYRTMHLLVLGLGPDATPAQVLRAMCSDLPKSSNPIETDAYNLAQRMEGWSFGVNPAQEMIQGNCLPRVMVDRGNAGTYLGRHGRHRGGR
jgi:hypothetical protein